MRLMDCKNYEVIVSALDDILNIDSDRPWNMSDFDYIVHTLNEHFNCDGVPLAEVVVALLNDCNRVITDKETVIKILVKYFGVPKNKINHKERSKLWK